MTERSITTSNLTGNTVYVLHGPSGAVTFEPNMRSVDYHDRTDRYNEGDDGLDCQYLHGDRCWTDGSGHAGRRLLARWEDSGRDDDVVWEVLERSYSRCWEDVQVG